MVKFSPWSASIITLCTKERWISYFIGKITMKDSCCCRPSRSTRRLRWIFFTWLAFLQNANGLKNWYRFNLMTLNRWSWPRIDDFDLEMLTFEESWFFTPILYILYILYFQSLHPLTLWFFACICDSSTINFSNVQLKS